MGQYSKNCILFFVKYPAEGKVKTRLAERLGQKMAVDLYRCFVADILETLQNFKASLKIFFDPSEDINLFQQWLGKEYSYIPQVGRDLGERMKNAFEQSFCEGFNNTIIIGSDSPDLPAEYLDLAFTALEKNDVVLGPGSDGGYYLIGFSKEAFLPQTFEQINWSSDRVLEQSIDKLKQHRKKVYLLPQWHDVDTAADLDELVERNLNTEFGQSETMILIEKTLNLL